uniref:Proline-rich receptor-like protein kinase PERK9 n=1 Tax=Anthurium amnicola TaxID=1678845 RepID=A0A1D1YEA0_9ARAE
MGFPSLNLLFLCLASLPSPLLSQQPYVGSTTEDCNNQHNSSSGLGYFCNGLSTACRTYLTFHSQSPYQSVSAISTLLGSDPSELARANAVSQPATFATGTKVFVPVNCSCSGGYYQANSSYLVQTDDTYLTIARNTYQGLSTCQALQNQNRTSSNGFLFAGITIPVPLRCACPTMNQSGDGVKYLLSYLVDQGDFVEKISSAFGVATQDILDANTLSLQPTIYPVTTLLIPLKSEPNTSQLSTPPPPPPPTSTTSSNRTGVYVGIGVAVAVLVIAISMALLCVMYRRRRKRAGQTTVTDASEIYQTSAEKPKGLTEEVLSGISDAVPGLKLYKFEELQLATEDFSAECRIEGSVYHAVLHGDAAAVKKMSRDISGEIIILRKINHFNLIGLSGVCFDQGTWYVVYEYMENGSLSRWIYDRTGSKVLSWIQRVRVAVDVANGLHYLHSYTDPPYVHKDIRSSNILLDGNLRAKIANFSLARPAGGTEGEFVLTRHIVGTMGYMAPEYVEHGLISSKLDVYALGIVMMELLTGMEAVTTHRGREIPLMEALISLPSEEDPTEKLRDFIDPLLEGKYPPDLALVMLKLIDGCLKKDAGRRPSMGEITLSLSGILATSLAWASSTGPAESQSFNSMGLESIEVR